MEQVVLGTGPSGQAHVALYSQPFNLVTVLAVSRVLGWTLLETC